jgi:ribonuclease HI
LSTEPEIYLYTDGACSGNPGPGGWAALLKHPATRRIKTLSGSDPNTTNNRMELMAVIEGLRAVRGAKRRRVRLICDSEYVINGLQLWLKDWIANSWRRGPKAKDPVKNADLWQTLHELVQRHDLTYEFVRGHSGHPENEECDRLAAAEIKAIKQRMKDDK